MPIDRRTFLTWLAANTAAGSASSFPSISFANSPRFKAVAFDAFTVFDPRPIVKTANTLFPEKGKALVNAWRARQFDYQWLSVLGEHYMDFWQATEAALESAARAENIALTSTQHEELMHHYVTLGAWPDAPTALEKLKNTGLRLVLLSNMTPAMLETNIQHANLQGVFQHAISTDRIHTYKPDPKAYALGPKTLGLKREEIVFAAFAGWDAVGAKWYGYPTFWVNRLGASEEGSGPAADASGRGLEELANFTLTAR